MHEDNAVIVQRLNAVEQVPLYLRVLVQPVDENDVKCLVVCCKKLIAGHSMSTAAEGIHAYFVFCGNVLETGIGGAADLKVALVLMVGYESVDEIEPARQIIPGERQLLARVIILQDAQENARADSHVSLDLAHLLLKLVSAAVQFCAFPIHNPLLLQLTVPPRRWATIGASLAHVHELPSCECAALAIIVSAYCADGTSSIRTLSISCKYSL